MWLLTGVLLEDDEQSLSPRVPPVLLSQPVHLLDGLRSLPSPSPSAGSELGSIVSREGGGDDGVVVRGAVLRVGPLLGLDLILEGDDLAGRPLRPLSG